MPKFTLSVIKADVGSIGGHTRPSNGNNLHDAPNSAKLCSMLDSILELAVVALPTIAGIAGWLMPVTERKPKHRYWVAIVGVALSVLIYLQQDRARTTHAKESTDLADKLGQLRKETEKLRGETDQLRSEHKTEVARRQQAERDLAIIVESTGRSTRTGVADDIRKSPISVNIQGQPTAKAAAKKRRIREALAAYMQQGTSLRDRCRTDDPNSKLEQEADAWYVEVKQYLKANLERHS